MPDRDEGTDSCPRSNSVSATALKLTLEISFNFFTTERVFRVGQYDGIDHFVAFNLSSEKRLPVQFLAGEFHSSTICESFNPLVVHAAPPSGDSVEDHTRLKTQTYKSSSYGLGTSLAKSPLHSKSPAMATPVQPSGVDTLFLSNCRRNGPEFRTFEGTNL